MTLAPWPFEEEPMFEPGHHFVCLLNVCVHAVCVHEASAHAWGSRSNLKDLILPLYHVGPWDQTQVIKLGDTHPY